MPRVAAARREQYAADRRDQILEAALRVFADKGFAETTMDEVAADAGLAKGSLYVYFPTKEDLLRKLLSRFTLLPELPQLMDSIRELPPRKGIPKLVTQIWRRFRERRELARVVVREIHSNAERARIFNEEVGLRAYRLLADYLTIWMKRGELRRADPLATSQCLFGMLWFFLLSQELMSGKEMHPLSDQAVGKVVSQMFLEGAAVSGPAPVRRRNPRRN
jgi:TetR/AcrR family transcriptional regulator